MRLESETLELEKSTSELKEGVVSVASILNKHRKGELYFGVRNVFKDRIEIYNPGDFPEGYSPQDFIRGDERSLPRNPLIAGVLYQSKDIEKWGSGLKRISKECAANGVRVDFKVLKSGFLVTFRRKPAQGVLPSSVVKAAGLGERLGEKIVEPAKDLFLGTRNKTRNKISSLILGNPTISVKHLAKLMGITAKAAEWHIAQLKAEGRLRRVGSRKAGHWELTQ